MGDETGQERHAVQVARRGLSSRSSILGARTRLRHYGATALRRYGATALVALLGVLLCLLVYQAPASYRLALAEADSRALSGFGGPEHNATGGFRWTTGEASLRLPPLGSPATLRVAAAGWRPADQPPPTLTVLLDGRPIAAWPTSRAPAVYEVTLPRAWLTFGGTHLQLRSETFVPGPRDRRTLGVAVNWIELAAPGGARRPVVPPLLVLGLSAVAPVLVLRAARHLRVPPWPALALTAAVALALATQAAADRAAWLLAAPAALLGLCLVALAAAVLPPVVARAAPGLRRAVTAVRLGLLPAWPEWEWVPGDELSPGRRQAVRLTVAGLAVGLLLLHLLSWFVPPEAEVWQSNLWGVRYIYRFPAWAPLALAVPPLLLAVPALSRRVWQGLAWWLAAPAARLQRVNPYLAAVAGGLLALPVLWLLRASAGEFGDSPELQRKIAAEGALWREREPLDFFLHAQAYRALHPLTGWDVPTIYAVFSCLAGALFVTSVVLLTALLARRWLDRLLAAGLILSAGVVQLFFGYLESYTLMTAGLTVYLLLGLLCLAGRIGVGWPATALGVAALLHPIALAAAPSLAVLLLHRWQQRRFRLADGWRLALPAAAGLVVPALLLVALFIANGYTLERWQIARNQFGGGDLRTFKPLVTLSSHREYYPLLSLDHLRAVANQQVLVAPLGWPLALALLLARRPAGLWRDPRFAYLLLAATTTLLFASLWNPDLGARQDWDLLAIGAVPAAALGAYLVVTLVPRGADRRYCGLLLLSVQLFHTGLWVASNSQALGAGLGP